MPNATQWNGGPDEDEFSPLREHEGRNRSRPPCDRVDCTDVCGFGSVTLGGLGQFCSRHCADKAEADFAERMQRKGFNKPERLARASGE